VRVAGRYDSSATQARLGSNGSTGPRAPVRDHNVEELFNVASATPIRRAPFADDPAVGARGLRTHRRLLDAALEAFGESGYDRASLDRIAELAGCSRVTVYQYFSGKDELFRSLATQVANQMGAALEVLDTVTPDATGRAALLAYFSRLADIEARYEPILRAFGAAAANDASLVDSAAAITRRSVGPFEARVAGTDLPLRLLDPIVELLGTGVVAALSRMSILRAAAPECYGRERVDGALADVAHRALFGPLPGVNVHPRPSGVKPPTLRYSPQATAIFERAANLDAQAAQPGKRTLRAMLAVANQLIADRGYRGLRINDVIEAAGVSRGSFYTYFDNIDDFVCVMGLRAIQHLSAVVRERPDIPVRVTLRRWLRRYAEVHVTTGPLVNVWIEAIEGPLRDERAAVIDWGRRRMATMLNARALGDVEIEAVILLAIIEEFGSKTSTKAGLDATLLLIERGFVGPDPGIVDGIPRR
jgi:AcrR family transcriptional regulator